MQAIIRLLSEPAGLYSKVTDDLFFLLYWTIGVYIVIRFISITSGWYLSRVPPRDREEIDQRVVRSIHYIFVFIFGFLAIIVLFEHFGITGTAFLASLTAFGIGGIIVGLAARKTLADIISGVVLLIDRPFRIGDRILIEKIDTSGDVIEIGWRSTRILTRDNRLVVIPNSIIGTDLVTNYSIPEKIFRVETDVVISYGPDIEYVRNLIIEAMEHEDWIMHEKPIQVPLETVTYDYGVLEKIAKISNEILRTAIINLTVYKDAHNHINEEDIDEDMETLDLLDIKNLLDKALESNIQEFDESLLHLYGAGEFDIDDILNQSFEIIKNSEKYNEILKYDLIEQIGIYKSRIDQGNDELLQIRCFLGSLRRCNLGFQRLNSSTGQY
jgi:small-conductance mechanosensitive channel